MFVSILIAFFLGTGLAFVWIKFIHEEKVLDANTQLMPTMDITLQDIITLASLNPMADINALFANHNIHSVNPAFYEEYMALNKEWKDAYFSQLVEIFSRDEREYARNLYESHPNMNNQDILLLLMDKMQLPNRKIAQIMGVTYDTLKKRKTRLKTKLQDGQPLTDGE